MSDDGDSISTGSPESPVGKGAAHASTRAEIEASLAAAKSNLSTLDAALDAAVASHGDLLRHISRLDLSRARLGTLRNTARALQKSQLAPAASTAAKISEAVRRLDTEQSRVRATLAVVEQVSTLRSCILGCVGSMGAPQDWETAASYLDRASQIPDNVIRSGFAESVVPTTEAPDPPAVTLENCRESLCALFLREFEKATAESDGAKVTRFFKMFPLIDRAEVGLDAYGRYVCQGVAARARERMQGISVMSQRTSQEDGGMVYAQTLTKLFEHVAQVVDGHTAVVERHYGKDTMIKVIERLHREVDIQGGIILDTWYDDRNIDRTLTEVKSYAFTFLVQSFLNVSRGGTGTPRSASPAPGRKGQVQEPVEEGVEMRQVDILLHELAMMLSHWALYLRFVSARAVPSSQTNGQTNDQITDLGIPTFLAESALPKKVQKVLTDPFNVFSTFFLRRSVEKAFQMEEAPPGLSLIPSKITNHNPPYITSAVDDVMYIVNQIMQRCLATSQAMLMASVSSTVGRVLGSDFIGMIQRKMRDEAYPKAAIQGAAPPGDKVISFLVLINNLDIATDYVQRIVRSHGGASADDGDPNAGPSGRPLSELFPIGRDATKVRSALSSLESSFNSKAIELANDGLAVAFSQVIKPRIRPLVGEAFQNVEYAVAEENGRYGNGEMDADHDHEEHAVAAVFRSGWDSLMTPIKRILSERNYQRLIVTAMSHVSSVLEKRIWSYQGRVSEHGAVRLEKDVTDIINAMLEGESFRLRENFGRCQQITTIMNMEEEEWDELSVATDTDIANDGWILNAQDRLRARIMVRGRD